MPRLWMGMAYKAVLHWNLSCLRQLWHQFLCATCLILLAAYKRFKTECNITIYHAILSAYISHRVRQITKQGRLDVLVMGDAMMWLILLSLLILFGHHPSCGIWGLDVLGIKKVNHVEHRMTPITPITPISISSTDRVGFRILFISFYHFLSNSTEFNKDTQHTLLAVAFPDPTSISHICTAS